jgi:uncharacterized glyoxalase superfamily protein PhnB
MSMTHGQLPDPSNVLSDWKDAVLHARLSLGGTELLGSDVPPDRFSAHALRLSFTERR